MGVNNLLENCASVIYPILNSQTELFSAMTIAGAMSRFFKSMKRTFLNVLAVILGVVLITSFIV